MNLGWSRALRGLLLAGLVGCGGAPEKAPSQSTDEKFAMVLMRVGGAFTDAPHEMFTGLADARLVPGVGLVYTTLDRRLVILDWMGNPLLVHDGSIEGPGQFRSSPALSVFGDTLLAYELSGRVHRFVGTSYVDSYWIRRAALPSDLHTGFGQLYDRENLAWTANQRQPRARQVLIRTGGGTYEILLDDLPLLSMSAGDDYIVTDPEVEQSELGFAANGEVIATWISGTDSAWIRRSEDFQGGNLVETIDVLEQVRPSSSGTVWTAELGRDDGSYLTREYSADGVLIRTLFDETMPMDSSGDTIMQIFRDREFEDLTIILVRTLKPGVGRD